MKVTIKYMNISDIKSKYTYTSSELKNMNTFRPTKGAVHGLRLMLKGLTAALIVVNFRFVHTIFRQKHEN